MKSIDSPEYRVTYDPETATITWAGSFRLRGEEYEPILELMSEAVEARPDLLMLDVRELQFLNSSGINTLSKFVLQVRKHNTSKLHVKGTNAYPWQAKSLKNLERLLPTLQLEL
jgi:hypothetical protein